MATIHITGLDKASVLMALHDGARPHPSLDLDRGPLTREAAEAILEDTYYIGYVNGRHLSVNLAADELHTAHYDDVNGKGAAERALAPLFAETKATV